MAKETEKRLIRTLEFLKEPQGSTIPTIVKIMNGEGPQVSLKRIVQTLRGCLENGLLKVSDGRVKLRQMSPAEDTNLEDGNQYLESCDRPESACAEHFCLNKSLCALNAPIKKYYKKNVKLKCPRSCPKGITIASADMGDNNNIPQDDGEGGGEGEGGGNCPPCPKSPRKKKRRCPKKKPKCPKPKRKPKCPKPKKKKSKKCPKKKVQPYCKKKKKCGMRHNTGHRSK